MDLIFVLTYYLECRIILIFVRCALKIVIQAIFQMCNILSTVWLCVKKKKETTVIHVMQKYSMFLYCNCFFLNMISVFWLIYLKLNMFSQNLEQCCKLPIYITFHLLYLIVSSSFIKEEYFKVNFQSRIIHLYIFSSYLNK